MRRLPPNPRTIARAATARGFTLVEVMVSIVLIGILLGVTTPSIVAQMRRPNAQWALLAASTLGQRDIDLAAVGGSTTNPRSMTYVNDAITDMRQQYSTITISGNTDANTDGIDDDGVLKVTLQGSTACVTLPTAPYAPVTWQTNC